MRRLVAALVLALSTAPAAAFDDDGTVACRLVDKPAVEHLLGAPIDGMRAEPFRVCAGMCESVNASLCLISVRRGGEVPEHWTLWADQAPFFPGNWPARTAGVDSGHRGAQFPWRGGVGQWDFDPRIGRGILHVYPGNRIHLLVVRENGPNDGAVALSEARFIAARALVLFDALPENAPR